MTNPPILLLDEITANLDSITEEKFVSVLQKASHTHTILSITHRLSSMIACDTVAILENGWLKMQVLLKCFYKMMIGIVAILHWKN